MGWAHWKQEDLAAALRQLRKAVELKPSYAEVHMWLGWLHLIRGRPEQGQKALELATDLSPEHAAAQEGLIWVRLRKGDVEGARRHVSRLPDRHPRVARHKADLAYHAGRWDRLRALARNRVDGDSNPLWHFYLARVEVVEGDSATARNHLSRIQKRPAGDMRHRAEALALAALGEEEATIRTWRRIGIVAWTGPHAVHVRYLYPDILNPLRERPGYQDLIQDVNQQLGLSPDGSLPEDADVSISPAGR
jgi:tetratricopeptide (TPR) repeat protein